MGNMFAETCIEAFFSGLKYCARIDHSEHLYPPLDLQDVEHLLPPPLVIVTANNITLSPHHTFPGRFWTYGKATAKRIITRPGKLPDPNQMVEFQ